MHRAITVGNRLCYKKNLDSTQQIYQQRLKNVTSQVDASRPKIYSIKMNPFSSKKQLLMKERSTEVSRSNKLLIQKISHIISTSSLKGMNLSQIQKSKTL